MTGYPSLSKSVEESRSRESSEAIEQRGREGRLTIAIPDNEQPETCGARDWKGGKMRNDPADCGNMGALVSCKIARRRQKSAKVF